VAGFFVTSASHAKNAAEVARDQAIAERDSAQADLTEAQAHATSLQSQYTSAESRAENLQAQVDASAWKARAFHDDNACINAIIAAYNASTYQIQLGAAMDNTFHNGACEKVFSFSAKNS
jgi:septal ring factor EnvC (AmiA/AmiB activator)